VAALPKVSRGRTFGGSCCWRHIYAAIMATPPLAVARDADDAAPRLREGRLLPTAKAFCPTLLAVCTVTNASAWPDAVSAFFFFLRDTSSFVLLWARMALTLWFWRVLLPFWPPYAGSFSISDNTTASLASLFVEKVLVAELF